MTLSLTKAPEVPPQSNWQTAPRRNRTNCSRRRPVEIDAGNTFSIQSWHPPVQCPSSGSRGAESVRGFCIAATACMS
eukprot:202863-Pyramimonas_sp.AAC.1